MLYKNKYGLGKKKLLSIYKKIGVNFHKKKNYFNDIKSIKFNNLEKSLCLEKNLKIFQKKNVAFKKKLGVK